MYDCILTRLCFHQWQLTVDRIDRVWRGLTGVDRGWRGLTVDSAPVLATAPPPPPPCVSAQSRVSAGQFRQGGFVVRPLPGDGLAPVLQRRQLGVAAPPLSPPATRRPHDRAGGRRLRHPLRRYPTFSAGTTTSQQVPHHTLSTDIRPSQQAPHHTLSAGTPSHPLSRYPPSVRLTHCTTCRGSVWRPPCFF